MSAATLALVPTYAFGYSYNRTFGPSDTGGGYGNYQGTLNFNSARQFSYVTYIQDICPADGYGVSFYFVVHRGNNTSSLTPPKRWDTNGCDNSVNYFDGKIDRSWNITSAQVAACWTNDGNLCWTSPPNGVSGVKDNPYT